VQHIQGNFVQSVQQGVHTKLKGRCQFLLILARVKMNIELIFLKQAYKKKIVKCFNRLPEIRDLLALEVYFPAPLQSYKCRNDAHLLQLCC